MRRQRNCQRDSNSSSRVTYALISWSPFLSTVSFWSCLKTRRRTWSRMPDEETYPLPKYFALKWKPWTPGLSACRTTTANWSSLTGQLAFPKTTTGVARCSSSERVSRWTRPTTRASTSLSCLSSKKLCFLLSTDMTCREWKRRFHGCSDLMLLTSLKDFMLGKEWWESFQPWKTTQAAKMTWRP